MLAWAGHAKSDAVLAFVGVWLLALIFQRIRTATLLRSGLVMHTLSPGTSWLVRLLLPWIEKERAARVTGAGLCFAVGGLIAAASEALGGMIMCCFFSTFFTLAVEAEVRKRQRQRMSDQRIEMAQRAAMYRGYEDD